MDYILCTFELCTASCIFFVPQIKLFNLLRRLIFYYRSFLKEIKIYKLNAGII